MYDIIPDIHGQSEKLKLALTNLGYGYRNGAWRHVDPQRVCVFLGDFIDRGPNNAEVIDIVRRMVDAETAFAIMGNHELNAIHFHTDHPTTGAPLRPHSEKNIRQHASFLSEFPLGDKKTADVLTWMKSLPLYLEFDTFRVVHACWNESVIGKLQAVTNGGVLSDSQFIEAADEDSKLFELVEITAKGPEARLPPRFAFKDKDGHERHHVRIKWWKQGAVKWADIAISVPDPSELPDTTLPAHVISDVYPSKAKPIFFGHYWLTGDPCLQADNALCLDYSAGKDGPLVSYGLTPGRAPIDLGNVRRHDQEPIA